MTRIISLLRVSDLLKDRDFSYSLFFSVLLHIIIILIFLFGIPSIIQTRFDNNDSMTFEVLPLSAIANVKEESPKINDNKKDIKPEDGKKNITKTIDKVQDAPQKSKDAPKIEKQQDSKKEIKPQKPKEEKIASKQADVKQINKPKKIESQPKPKEKDKTQKKMHITKKVHNVKKDNKTGDELDSLLNDLEQSAGDDKKSNIIAGNNSDGLRYTRSAVYDDDSPLSITEKMLVTNQIKRNWQPPVGVQQIEGIKVSLRMKLNPDGSVDTVDIIKVQCPMQASYICKLVAESAIRAVKKSSPFKDLVADRHDVWQYFNVIFDPSD